MTDPIAEVVIEKIERYARVDTKPESDGNPDMNPNPSETSKSKYLCRVSYVIDSNL